MIRLLISRLCQLVVFVSFFAKQSQQIPSPDSSLTKQANSDLVDPLIEKAQQSTKSLADAPDFSKTWGLDGK